MWPIYYASPTIHGISASASAIASSDDGANVTLTTIPDTSPARVALYDGDIQDRQGTPGTGCSISAECL